MLILWFLFKMKTVIALFVIASLLVTLVVLDEYFIAVQDREIKESDLVQNCKPPGPDQVVPLIGIYNNTHGFDLLTCTWYSSDNGTPGLVESLYTSFVEPHILDLLYGFTFQYAYAIPEGHYEKCIEGKIFDQDWCKEILENIDELDTTGGYVINESYNEYSIIAMSIGGIIVVGIIIWKKQK